MKTRLDQALVSRGIFKSRSQAANYIKLGKVSVNDEIELSSSRLVVDEDILKMVGDRAFVSRAAHKLEAASKEFKLLYRGKTILDVGSSTGGFTEYALLSGAERVFAVDVGSNQMDRDLALDPRIELHENTDIRDVGKQGSNKAVIIPFSPDIIVADVSFISLTKILDSVAELMNKDSILVAMCKPQFEARESGFKHKGVIKNNNLRRKILADFEIWLKPRFLLLAKADSQILGASGNQERFYLLKKLAK